MARQPKGQNEMAQDNPSTNPPEAATGEGTKKRRKPQGPRKPSPLYVFVTVDPNAAAGQQVKASQQFRDPRKMAEYFPTANANGEQLLIVAPEA